jgi:hypothetical protein
MWQAGEFGEEIFRARDPSKVSRSCPQEETEIGLETELILEKQDGIRLLRGQAKHDQACSPCHPDDMAMRGLENFKAT